MFLAGLTGSAVHCGPMCGVFVLGQVSERMARVPAQNLCEWQRLRQGVLLPYHLGRITTYAGMGALAAGSVGFLQRSPLMHHLATALLVLAALLCLAHAMARAMARVLPVAVPSRSMLRIFTRVIGRFISGERAGQYFTGVALGFLPCGFLYAAVLSSAALARPLMGGLAMALFGLGTTPILAAVGVTGVTAYRRWPGSRRLVAPAVMALNAGLLLVLAWRGVT